VLAASVAAWVTGFDIIYACQDADFDKRVGLHSIPARFGVAGALKIAAMSHVLMIGFLALLAYVGVISGLGKVFAGAVAVTAILVIFQHWLVRPDDLTRVNIAFFNTNAAISVLLLAAGTVDCLV
jgi:4-hydroxybenzoate polyprenyltransferase